MKKEEESPEEGKAGWLGTRGAFTELEGGQERQKMERTGGGGGKGRLCGACVSRVPRSGRWGGLSGGGKEGEE